METKSKIYWIVWCGRIPGVYDNWKDCKRQIKNFKGAVYKKYSTLGPHKDLRKKVFKPTVSIPQSLKKLKTFRTQKIGIVNPTIPSCLKRNLTRIVLQSELLIIAKPGEWLFDLFMS